MLNIKQLPEFFGCYVPNVFIVAFTPVGRYIYRHFVINIADPWLKQHVNNELSWNSSSSRILHYSVTKLLVYVLNN